MQFGEFSPKLGSQWKDTTYLNTKYLNTDVEEWYDTWKNCSEEHRGKLRCGRNGHNAITQNTQAKVWEMWTLPKKAEQGRRSLRVTHFSAFLLPGKWIREAQGIPCRPFFNSANIYRDQSSLTFIRISVTVKCHRIRSQLCLDQRRVLSLSTPQFSCP